MPPEWFDTTQRATGGGHRVQAAHLGAEVPLDGRSHPVRDLPGEPGIPFGGFWLSPPRRCPCLACSLLDSPGIEVVVISKKRMSYPQVEAIWSDTVLVTGGFGLVGSATVRRLGGRSAGRVVATDLDTPANRKAQPKLPARRRGPMGRPDGSRPGPAAWSPTSPRARSFTSPRSSRRRSTATPNWRDRSTWMPRQPWFVSLKAQPTPPRFVHASSNAVFGARNPHRTTPPLRAGRPDAALRRLQRTEGRGRGDRAVVEPGMGRAAVRR